MRALTRWLIALFTLYDDGGEGEGTDDDQTGVTGKHPATGGGTDDELGGEGEGLLDSVRKGQVSQENLEGLKLTEEETKTLALNEEQQRLLADKKPAELTKEQKESLKAIITSRKSTGKQDAAIKALVDQGIPEQFIDKEKGTLKNDSLIKAWKDTRAALKTLQKDKGGERPEKPEDYKFEQTEKLKDLSYAKEMKNDDPALSLFRNIAHTLNLTQEQFQNGVELFLTGASDFMPESISIDDEKKKLGEGGDAVMKAVYSWGENLQKQGLWSEDEFEEIVIMGSTALGMRALNKLREHFGGEKVIPLKGGTGDTLPSAEELYAMAASDKYQTDPAERARVDALFVKVFGTDPAGTSVPGMGVNTAVNTGKK